MENTFTFFGANQLLEVRPMARKLATDIGFDNNSSISISSTFTDLIQYVTMIGDQLSISMKVVKKGRNVGLQFTVNALTTFNLRSKFSVNGRLGSGFENIKRRMDNFCISSSGGELTLVIRKWIPVA
ncbi:MAG: hypothetical protein ACLFQM_04845 [Fidelibacterota bacterium]